MQTIEVTQYMRPSGHKKPIYLDVPDDVAVLSKGMSLSAEVLMTDQVVLYATYPDWDEEDELMEFAFNGPGGKNPQDVIIKLIKDCYAKNKEPK